MGDTNHLGGTTRLELLFQGLDMARERINTHAQASGPLFMRKSVIHAVEHFQGSGRNARSEGVGTGGGGYFIMTLEFLESYREIALLLKVRQ